MERFEDGERMKERKRERERKKFGSTIKQKFLVPFQPILNLN